MGDNPVTRDELDALVEKVESLEDDLEEERERRREAEQRVDDLEDRLDSTATVEWESSNFTDARVESADGTTYPLGPVLDNKPSEMQVEQRLDDLRERLADGDLADQDDRDAPAVETETPLEDVVALPEDVAESNLSANQQRARFLAKDAREYGEAAMSGRVLKAGRVGRVLRAGLDVEPHPETVRRVMEILADLADDQGTLRKRAGEKRVVLEDDLLDRLERVEQAHDVVSPETA